MKFGQHMDVDDPKVDLEGQRSRSRGQKTLFTASALANLDQCISMQIEPSVQYAFR